MTDDQVEKVIWREIKRKDITLSDMIGMPNCGVDPHPKDENTSPSRKAIRSNRFQSIMGCDRMKEILCRGPYNIYDSYPALKVPFRDLFRFWWNRCVQKEEVADEVLEDIFDYFAELMRPPEKEEPRMDLTLSFKHMALLEVGQGDEVAAMKSEKIEAGRTLSRQI